jgi:hypothetical protein
MNKSLNFEIGEEYQIFGEKNKSKYFGYGIQVSGKNIIQRAMGFLPKVEIYHTFVEGRYENGKLALAMRLSVPEKGLGINQEGTIIPSVVSHEVIYDDNCPQFVRENMQARNMKLIDFVGGLQK